MNSTVAKSASGVVRNGGLITGSMKISAAKARMTTHLTSLGSPSQRRDTACTMRSRRWSIS